MVMTELLLTTSHNIQPVGHISGGKSFKVLPVLSQKPSFSCEFHLQMLQEPRLEVSLTRILKYLSSLVPK